MNKLVFMAINYIPVVMCSGVVVDAVAITCIIGHWPAWKITNSNNVSEGSSIL